jgi:hypothetical protein
MCIKISCDSRTKFSFKDTISMEMTHPHSVALRTGIFVNIFQTPHLWQLPNTIAHLKPVTHHSPLCKPNKGSRYRESGQNRKKQDETSVTEQRWWLIWHSEESVSWYILIVKANEMHYFSYLFDEVFYVFWTCPLYTIRSISTLYTRNRNLSF